MRRVTTGELASILLSYPLDTQVMMEDPEWETDISNLTARMTAEGYVLITEDFDNA